MKSPALVSICLFLSLNGFTQAWIQLPDVPESLTFPAVVTLGQNIHMIGGGGPSGATDLHLRFNTVTETWDSLAPVPYLAQQPSGAVVNGKIHFFGGGFPNSGTPLDDHYSYDPGTDSWSMVVNIPANRVIHEAATLGDSIYVMGGQPDKLRFERYDAFTNTWKSLNNLPDQNFWYGAILAAGGEMYRFGGGGYLSPQNTAMKYDVQTDSWTSLPNMPEGLHAVDAGVIGDSIFLVGGYDQWFSETNMVWIYNMATQNYDTGFTMPSARNYHSVASVGACIYAIGGHDQTVDRSIIRHCRGDKPNFTSVETSWESSSLDLRVIQGVLNVQAEAGSSDAQLAIFDISGRQVHAETIQLDGNGKGSADLNGRLKGDQSVYIARLECKGRLKTLQFQLNSSGN